MPLKYEVCFGTKYEKGGEERTRWTKHGAVIEKDGKFYLKLESIPVGGKELFFNLFTPKKKEEQKQKSAPAPESDDPDDDVPF